MFRTSFMYVNRTRKFVVKIWSEWNVARLVLPVSAIVVLFWTAGLWTGNGTGRSEIWEISLLLVLSQINNYSFFR